METMATIQSGAKKGIPKAIVSFLFDFGILTNIIINAKNGTSYT